MLYCQLVDELQLGPPELFWKALCRDHSSGDMILTEPYKKPASLESAEGL